MTEEPSLRGFVARLETKSECGKLTYNECKYIEAQHRVAKRHNESH